MVTTRENGMNLTYHNIESDILMDCGTSQTTKSINDILKFAVIEGACQGDGLYVDGMLVCVIDVGESFPVRMLN